MAHPTRIGQQTVDNAVVLGVAFVVGSLLFTGHLQGEYARLAHGRVADAVVAPKGALDPDRRDTAVGKYSPEQVTRVAAIPGVRAAEAPVTMEGIAFKPADGTSAVNDLFPAVAMGWTEFPVASADPALALAEGQAPRAGEVVLDRATFEKAGYRIGDSVVVTLPVGEGTREVRLTMSGVGVLPGLETLTAEEAAELQGSAQAEAVAFLRPLLLGFAGLAAVVACFLIVNTFSILVLQRTRELALLPALGAGRGQVRRLVMLETLGVGLVGSVLGVLAGWGLAAGLMGVTGLVTGVSGAASGMPLSATAVVAGLAVGLVVTLLASLLPAARAGGVAPVVAMSGVTARERVGGAKRVGDGPPAFGRPLARLAGLNARRRPGRTLATALTLTIGLFLVGLLGTMGASIKASVNDLVPQTMTADFMVSSHAPIDRAQMERLARVDGVLTVRRFEMVGASVGAEQTSVMVAQPADYGQLISQKFEAGRPAERAYELVVNKPVLEEKGWAVGQRIAGVVQGQDVAWVVVGTFAYPPNIAMADFYAHPETLQALGLGDQPGMMAVKAVEGADLARVGDGLRAAMSGLSGAQVVGLVEYRELAGAQVNTLGLSIVERRRELGLLRAVGMARGQVRGLVMRESLMIAVVGGFVGLGLGVAAGAGLQALIADQLTALVVPWGQVGVAAGLAVVIGLVAALGPAARASRADILEAVADG